MAVVEVKFSKQELNTFAKSSDTCVTVKRKTRVLFVNPAQFSNLSSGIRENLDLLLLKYDFLFKAIILGYNRIKILSRYGSICYGRSNIALQVEADFYLFNPAVGSKLQGVVCKRSGHHLGCLVHKAFNVFIPINEDDYMTGWDFSIGQEVIFTVVNLDLTSGPLPYIRGQLDIEEAERTDGVGSKVDKDSEISYGHEDETGGWDSGVALSSPGRDTVESESMEKEDDSRQMLHKRTLEKSSVDRRKQSRSNYFLKNKETQKHNQKYAEMALGNVDVLSSPRKHTIEDEKTKQDDEKSMRQEGSEESVASPKSAAKKKGILKNKKEDSSLKEEDLMKELLKTTEKSFGIEETELSKKDNANVLTSSGKHTVESRITVENEPNHMIEETTRKSVMSPKQTPKKRKSIAKNKKEETSTNEDVIMEFMKTVRMSFGEEKTEPQKKEEPKESSNIEDEQKADTIEQNLTLGRHKPRSSLGTASKDSEHRKKLKSACNVSPIGEDNKMISTVETQVEKSVSDKIHESLSVMESKDKVMTKQISTQSNVLEETMLMPQNPVLNKNRKSLGKNKESTARNSISKGDMTSKSSVSVNEKVLDTSKETKKEVDVDIEKLLAMNKKLLGIDSLGDDMVSEDKHDKSDKLSSEEKKTKKRKRESKDVSESPQRKKVLRKSIEKIKSPKVLKSDSSIEQSKVMSPKNVEENNASPQSQTSASKGASVTSPNSESFDAVKSTPTTSFAKKDKADLPESPSVSSVVKKSSANHKKTKRKSIAPEVDPNLKNHVEKLLLEAMQAQNK